MSISSQSFLEYLNSSNIVPIAHRGASLVAAENSFESFRKAFDLGYRVIETDIHSSKDGTAYIFCLLYTSPSPRDRTRSRMPSSA